jgi:DNA-binding FadR family transcriptional regulator
MSPAHVLEPTYRQLKRAIMDGCWPGGTRLEALRLADELGVSMTPVRDSLNQLVGEGLVDLTPGEGFRVPVITEQVVRDLLRLNEKILETASECEWTHVAELTTSSGEYADRVSAVFVRLAERSRNRVLTDVVARIGERLHPIRRREPDILADAWQILGELEEAFAASNHHLGHVLRRYHRDCQQNVSRLVGIIAP